MSVLIQQLKGSAGDGNCLSCSTCSMTLTQQISIDCANIGTGIYPIGSQRLIFCPQDLSPVDLNFF